MKRWLFVFLLLLVVAPRPAIAQDRPQLQVYPEDKELTFASGFAGEDDTFVGHVELTAVGGDIDTFRFVAHGLEREDGKDGEEIAPTRIRLLGDRRLRVGATKVFPVTVSGVVEEPGTYTGVADIQPQGDAQFDERQIELELVANVRPAVALEPETSSVNVNLVTCKTKWWDLRVPSLAWPVPLHPISRIAPPIIRTESFPLTVANPDCALARFLIGDKAVLKTYALKVRNDAHDDVQITSTEVVVTGDQGSEPWTKAGASKEVWLPKGKTLQPQRIHSIPLTFYRENMTPGHYGGYISMMLKDGHEPLQIPVDATVRTGPMWAILALAIGVGIGQMARLLESGGTPSKALSWQLRVFKALTLVGAVLVGLTVVYGGQQGATFGANGMADILAIGAWGFAADLSSRGLIRHFRPGDEDGENETRVRDDREGARDEPRDGRP